MRLCCIDKSYLRHWSLPRIQLGHIGRCPSDTLDIGQDGVQSLHLAFDEGEMLVSRAGNLGLVGGMEAWNSG